jgi:hypothetical protein
VDISLETFLLYGQAKKEALNFLHLFSSHNFACKTMLIETGGLHAVAVVIRANWENAAIRLVCKELLEKI